MRIWRSSTEMADKFARGQAVGTPGVAAAWHEQGRSVMWTQLLQLRTDLAMLAESAPGLAQRLDAVRGALQAPASGTGHAASPLPFR
nr:hypothetical protein GCM10020063_042100 [Dactylosporangium thailandense]